MYMINILCRVKTMTFLQNAQKHVTVAHLNENEQDDILLIVQSQIHTKHFKYTEQ